jgi:hypothetical protein
MIASETFALLDLIKYCPFEFQISPQCKIAKEVADKWLNFYDIRNAKNLEKGQSHMLTAMTHFTVDVKPLCV